MDQHSLITFFSPILSEEFNFLYAAFRALGQLYTGAKFHIERY